MKNNKEITYILCRITLLCSLVFFSVFFVKMWNPCLLTSYCVLYNESRKIIKIK